MNHTKGFRFHPTDAEAVELLWDKIELRSDSIVQVGDSLVPVITQLKDICEFQPWELPGRSELQSGNSLWYFFTSPRYKYRNSERKNRVTKKGYWKPTGKPRKIVTKCNGKEITGIRQTLVFYKGRVSDKKKNENRTPWVIHEITLDLPNRKCLSLCKLKKKHGKVEGSRGEEGQSSHLLPSNLENQCTTNAIPKDQLKPTEPLTESEALTDFQSQITNNEQDDDEFVGSFLINNDEFCSIQPYFVDENGGPRLSSTSNFQIHQVADNDVPKNQEGFCELTNQKLKATDEYVGTLNELRTSDHENSSWSSILIANDQTFSKEGSSLFAEVEGFSLGLKSHVAMDSIPMEYSDFDEFLRNGIFMAELSPMQEEPKNSHGVQDHQFISTNEQDDGFWNSTFLTTDEIEAYAEVLRSKRQNLAAKSAGFNFTTSAVELPNDPCPMELLDLEKICSLNTEQAQVDSYNKGDFEYDGSVTYN